MDRHTHTERAVKAAAGSTRQLYSHATATSTSETYGVYSACSQALANIIAYDQKALYTQLAEPATEQNTDKGSRHQLFTNITGTGLDNATHFKEALQIINLTQRHAYQDEIFEERPPGHAGICVVVNCITSTRRRHAKELVSNGSITMETTNTNIEPVRRYLPPRLIQHSTLNC